MISQSRLFIIGGRVVNDDQSFEADVYIEDGHIKLVGSNLLIPGGTRTIDATGKLVMPGGIDTNTHMQLPVPYTVSVDDFFGGTKAAVAGGTTTIVDCVMVERGQSVLEAYKTWRDRADPAVCCDYALRVCIGWWSEQVAQEIQILAKEKGVNTVLLCLGYEDQYMLDDTQLYKAFTHCRQLGILVQVHAENGTLISAKTKEIAELGIRGPEGHLLSRTEEAEAEAVNRAITLASQANTPIYVTKVASKSAADVIARSRKKGKVVFGESLSAALAVDGSHYYDKSWRHAAAYVISPPLRTAHNTCEYLTDLLTNGDLQTTASDHCTFNADQKALGKDDFRLIPHGINGVEERLAIVWKQAVATGKMDMCRFVAVTSTNAAKLFNIYPSKGRIAVGSDADIVIWNPTASKTISAASHTSKCDFNIFEGMTCSGVPEVVIAGGCILLDEQGLQVNAGQGKFISTPCNSELAYSKIWTRQKLSTIQPVQREAYVGPVHGVGAHGDAGMDAVNPHKSASQQQDFHSRPPTSSGGRNMQDSTFSLSGMTNSTQIDEVEVRTGKRGCGTRINQPPGGKTSQLW